MKTVLLLDDSPDLLELMKNQLERDGFTVVTAENGLEGIDVLLRSNVDAIITDFQMPKMNGVTFVNTARAMGFSKPIIMWSGSEDPKIVGLNSFIPKTSKPKVVVSMLSELILLPDQLAS